MDKKVFRGETRGCCPGRLIMRGWLNFLYVIYLIKSSQNFNQLIGTRNSILIFYYLGFYHGLTFLNYYRHLDEIIIDGYATLWRYHR